MQEAVFAAAIALYRPGRELPSLIAIAQKANVQKTTLYRRWGSSEAILHAAITRDVKGLSHVPDTGTLHGDLRELVSTAAAFLASAAGKDSIRMLLHTNDAEKQAYWTRRYGQLEIIFERAMQRGEWTDDLPWQRMLDGLIGMACFGVLLRGEHFTEAELLQLADAFVEGCEALRRKDGASR